MRCDYGEGSGRDGKGAISRSTSSITVVLLSATGRSLIPWGIMFPVSPTPSSSWCPLVVIGPESSSSTRPRYGWFPGSDDGARSVDGEVSVSPAGRSACSGSGVGDRSPDCGNTLELPLSIRGDISASSEGGRTVSTMCSCGSTSAGRKGMGENIGVMDPGGTVLSTSREAGAACGEPKSSIDSWFGGGAYVYDGAAWAVVTTSILSTARRNLPSDLCSLVGEQTNSVSR